MLYVHDTYAVMGESEFEFEDSIRDAYAPGLDPADARLLWYLYAVHGAGQAHHVVTVTAVRDGAAWERLTQQLRYGSLAEWRTSADSRCYRSSSSLLVDAPWSPLAGAAFDSLPTDLPDGDVLAFREDTLEGPTVVATVRPSDAPSPADTLRPVAGFRPALAPDGSLRILYGLAPNEQLEQAVTADVGWGDWSGSLTKEFPAGVRGTSRMLRSTRWSPMGQGSLAAT